jgi:hypothetical protein
MGFTRRLDGNPETEPKGVLNGTTHANASKDKLLRLQKAPA